MQSIIQFYAQNHAIINFLIAVVIYVIAHRQAAFAYVRNHATKAMFGVEKAAEQLLLNTGDAKMQMVVEMVYERLPGWVRVVVSINRFRAIAQHFYDDAKQFIQVNATVPTKPAATAAPAAPNQSA